MIRALVILTTIIVIHLHGHHGNKHKNDIPDGPPPPITATLP